jgi:hypothetical protein
MEDGRKKGDGGFDRNARSPAFVFPPAFFLLSSFFCLSAAGS